MKEKEKNTMNQRIYSPIENPTEDELEVAKILLDLPNIVSVSESRRSKFEWVGRRRRSSLDAGASSSRAPSSLSQSVQNETVHRVKVATASPDTPLSFSPSESDENNNKHSSKKNINKRSREEYLDMIDQLTQRGDCLRGEIENVMKYYNKLKAQNSELKAMKQEVLKIYQSKEESSQMETSREASYRVEQAHQYQVALVPYVADQAFQFPIGPNAAQLYNNGLRMVNDVGPRGIPDLNLSAEEAFGVVDAGQPLDVNRAYDDRRARFAENRRLRRGKIKIKNMRNECGIKLPRLS